MELGLEPLLRLAWAAAVLPILLASLPLPFLGCGFLHRALSAFAARGKTAHSSSRKFTVPQRYFLHFYVVAVVLTTCLALSTWFYAYREMVPLASKSLEFSTIASHLTGGSHIFSIQKRRAPSMEHKLRVWRTVFVLLLMEAQALRRLYETLNVFNYSPSARMHIFGYLVGMFFYTAAPLSFGNVCSLEALTYTGGQITQFIVKGRARMSSFEFNLWELVKPFLSLGWCQRIGAAIFFWGWFHQLRSHLILVIYAGILVASGGSDITLWLLFLFVVANLVFAGAETHRWYCHKFDNYPSTRRAIIPWIF